MTGILCHAGVPLLFSIHAIFFSIILAWKPAGVNCPAGGKITVCSAVDQALQRAAEKLHAFDDPVVLHGGIVEAER